MTTGIALEPTDMKVRSIRRQRSFSLDVSLPPLSDYAWDVINSIEKETIEVVDPTDPAALDEVTDSTGAFLLDSDAKLTVKLSDWIAVGCQKIRWEEPEENILPIGTGGVYTSNFQIAFGRPGSESPPLGPSVFIAEIVLPLDIRDTFLQCETKQDIDSFVSSFQFIVAHELVHVFDKMKYLVPAFMNWRAFRTNILADGMNSDNLLFRMSAKSGFVDDYAKQNELESIRIWWPSRADEWFRARPQPSSPFWKKGTSVQK